MSNLLYINQLGSDYRGNFMYEFIFGDTKEAWGEEWDKRPANGYPSPPELDCIRKVGVLKNSKIKLELIQNSDIFSFTDAMDNVIAVGWEQEDEDKDFSKLERLVFHFGEDEQKIKDKLYSRDIILEFEKNTIYEN